MRTLTKLSTVEAKLFLRDPVGAFFAIAFPAVVIVVLGNAIPDFRKPAEDLGGRLPLEVYLPVTLALAINTVAMITLLNVLSAYRERGVLRRLSTTPVSPTALLGAQLVVNLIALVVGCTLAFISAMLVFDIPGPKNWAGLLISFALGAASTGAVALFIAAVTPSTTASTGLGTVVYFPMLFAAGVWTPGPMMPDAVQRVADFTPLGAASQAMQGAWEGDWPRPLHLAVMVAGLALFGWLAARLFRWE